MAAKARRADAGTAEPPAARRRAAWRAAGLEGLLVSGVVLGLFYYWFGVADRYRVFLYGHTTSGIPPAQPFDAITASRY